MATLEAIVKIERTASARMTGKGMILEVEDVRVLVV
jgi:hypothetical protein